MNKVNNKNRNNSGNKKCNTKDNGAQIQKSEPPETIAINKDIEDLKNKVKITKNGLVNGSSDSKSETNLKTKDIKIGTDNIDKLKEIALNIDFNLINGITISDDSIHSVSDKRKPIEELANDSKLINTSDCKIANSDPIIKKVEPTITKIYIPLQFANDQPSTSSGIEPTKSSKKPKSKKRNSHKESCEDMNSPDFDITLVLRNKYLAEDAKMDKDQKEVKLISNLDNLEIKDVQKEEEPWVENPTIEYVEYQSELQMPLIMKIIQKDLSEPYSIYTYRYFIHNWPNLCFLAMSDDLCVGAIVCKLDMHRKVIKRGYIAMLAVDKRYRKHGIGSTLVIKAIEEMINGDADEVVLETEITNKPALRLYEALGFVRDKRLFRYYLNGVDALRLKLWLR